MKDIGGILKAQSQSAVHGILSGQIAISGEVISGGGKVLFCQELTDLPKVGGEFSASNKIRRFEMEKYDPTYGIGDASKLTGVSQRQLRNWEGKFIPRPSRSVCGARAYRRYTQEEIDLILRIKAYLQEGYTLARASEKAGFKSTGGDTHAE